jgi:RNase P protein component
VIRRFINSYFDMAPRREFADRAAVAIDVPKATIKNALSANRVQRSLKASQFDLVACELRVRGPAFIAQKTSKTILVISYLPAS